MRKVLVSLLAISFFMTILCSCKKVEQKSPVVCFDTKVLVTVGQLKLDTKVTSAKDNNIIVTVLSDKTLGTLEYQKANKTLYIRYKGLECTADSDYLQDFNPFGILITALCNMQNSQYSYKTQEDGCCVYTTRCGEVRCEVLVDSTNGYIKCIKPQLMGMRFDFFYT